MHVEYVYKKWKMVKTNGSSAEFTITQLLPLAGPEICTRWSATLMRGVSSGPVWKAFY